ncbi:MAG TPA: DoxX family protein [Amycolatopsis sp.]|nr:DoxX family protein [Amycolatopsis sp.]
MSRIRDLSLLAGRGVLGGYLAAHGAQKLWAAFGGPGLDPVAGAFDKLGLRPGRAMARLAGISEFGGGLLTVAGLADPLGPLAIAGTMAVAGTTHGARGPFAANGGYELPLSNLAAALTLAATGPGRYSLDRLTGGNLPGPLTRLIALGTAGGVLANVAMMRRAKAAPSTTADDAVKTEER